jgi:lactate dehydrogenase-like 2-hydroxyacid dehydrogenase
MHKERVLRLGEITPAADEALAARFEVHRFTADGIPAILEQYGPRIRAIATRGREPTTAALIDQLPALEIIANFGVGYDTIDLPAAVRRGVIVTNTPGVLDDEVADFAVGLLLATVRRLPQADRWLRTGQWLKAPFPLSPSLRDRTVGIVGMGRIGQRIAKRITAFEVPVVYHARHPRPGLPWRYYSTLLEMAREVDTLVLVVPGGPGTRHLVNADVLAALGPRGILLNVARGSVVDEEALVRALRDGTILGAGLDVFADEPRVPAALLDNDNVVVLPHIGSASHRTRGLMGQMVVDNLMSWFDGGKPLTPVLETPWPRPAT